MKARKVNGGHFLRIDKGEEIISTIVDYAEKENMASGVISGLGALTEVTLGYFDRQERKYLKRTFNDVFELLSLNGNLSYVGQKPMVHAHCVLGGPDYRVIGGHLFSGIVAVTGEIYIQIFTEKFNRQLDHEFNLNLLAY